MQSESCAQKRMELQGGLLCSGCDQPLCCHAVSLRCALPAAGGNSEIGQLIADAMAKVGRQGVVTMEESKTAEDNLVFVEGMQVCRLSLFDRGLTLV